MRIRLVILFCAVAAIIFGILIASPLPFLAGAILFTFVETFDLFHIYQVAKLIRAGESPLEASTAEKFGDRIRGIIILIGFVVFLFTQDRSADGYYIAGLIIWGGGIVFWFLTGIILREVGGVPLRMGYGGWAVRRGKNGRILR